MQLPREKASRGAARRRTLSILLENELAFHVAVGLATAAVFATFALIFLRHRNKKEKMRGRQVPNIRDSASTRTTMSPSGFGHVEARGNASWMHSSLEPINFSIRLRAAERLPSV